MTPLSFYVLTHNSEKYLERILEKVSAVADEIIIVDSGSTDSTQEIARRYTPHFYTRKLDHFVNQRTYALEKCQNEWVWFLDSDEIPSQELIDQIGCLKSEGFHEGEGVDAYRLIRRWHLMGKPVRALYPVSSPDYPIRLFLKRKGTYDGSTVVHETMRGFDRQEVIENGFVDHMTFETREEIDRKLQDYTRLAAEDAKNRGKSGGPIRAIGHGFAAFIKWYFLKGACKNGRAGVEAGRYAFLYTYYKYLKLGQPG